MPISISHAGGTPKEYNIKRWGAVGNGIADDTLVIQSVINACPDGDIVFIPTGLYKITSTLSITKNISLMGEGAYEIWDTVANSNGTSVPGAAPWLNGSVLLQSTAATNGIEITGTGNVAHLKNFGIRFADAIAFSNTGHGIYAVSTAMSGLGHENGVTSSQWENVIVFGHDGNHYAFYSINNNLATCIHLRGYGGGGWYQEVDSYASAYGNGVIENAYFGLFVGGTAHGFHLKSRTTSFPGSLNLMVFIRPQCNMMDFSASPTPIGAFTPAAPLATQYRWIDEGDPPNILLISPDLETSNAILSPVSFGLDTAIEPAGGLLSNPPGIPTSIYHTKKHYVGTPTITYGSGAGTVGDPSGSVVPVFGMPPNDERGKIQFITSQFPFGADGAKVMTVTLEAWFKIGAVFIQPMPYDGFLSMSAGFYVNNVTNTTFEVWSHTGLADTSKYAFEYLVVE